MWRDPDAVLQTRGGIAMRNAAGASDNDLIVGEGAGKLRPRSASEF